MNDNPIMANETWFNGTNNYIIGESGVYVTRFTNKGEAYREYHKLYGKCIGKIYIDTASGKPRAIGWAFRKRAKYKDVGEYFTQETWVTLHKSEPVGYIEYNYDYL